MTDSANTAIIDGLRLKGEFDIVHIRDGVILSAERIPNLIVYKGKEQVSKLLIGTDNRPFRYIQIGTGTTSASVEDVGLANFYRESGGEGETGAVVSAIVDAPPDSAPAYRSVITYTFTFAEPASITEAGIFNGARGTSPVMLSRQTFAARDVISGDNLQVTWRFTIG